MIGFGAYTTLRANTSEVIGVTGAEDITSVQSDGFTVGTVETAINTAGVTYLYMVAYDTNANGGGTYYPRTQDTSMLEVSNAQIMYSDGYANGTAKNTSEVLSGATYPTITYHAGYNYIKKAKDGSFSATVYEPKFGEADGFSDCYIDGKWWNNVAVFKDDFSDGDVSDWTATNATATFINGDVVVTNSGANYGSIKKTITVIPNVRYKIIGSSAVITSIHSTRAYRSDGITAIAISDSDIFNFEFITNESSVVIAYVNKVNVDGYSSTLKNISIIPLNDDGSIDTTSSTPLGNITYLPIKVLADAGGQIVLSESWKYPEIVSDGIATRSLKVTEEFDLGQTWKNVMSKRALGITYTNSTGKPIMVAISWKSSSGAVAVTVGGMLIVTGTATSTSTFTTSFIVPNSTTYVVGGGNSFVNWSELR